MITRYAYVKNGQTIWGPGPNPYYITLQNGDIWEISAHTIGQSEVEGIFIVEQVDQRDFDEKFEQSHGPTYSIRNGRPIETWTYSFIPSARDNMVEAIDAQSEALRQEIATKYAGQFAEYDEVYRQAVEVSKLAPLDVIPEGKYDYLEADIDVTFSEILNRNVETVREAADLVILKRNLWQLAGGIIRKLRLLTKKQIRECATDAEAYEICKKYLSNETYYDYVNS